MTNYLNFDFEQNVDGFRATVRRPASGQAVPILIGSGLLKSSALGGATTNLAAALAATARTLSDGSRRYTERGYREWLTPEIVRPVSRAFRECVSVAGARRSSIQHQRDDWATPRFVSAEANDARAPIRVEMRNRLASMKPAQGVEAALRNFDLASAMAEGGEALALAMGWTPDLWAMFLDTFSQQNLARRLADQHGYRLRPVATDVLRAGADLEAATRAAQETVAAHDASLAEVDGVRVVLNSVVDFSAVAMASRREAAFDMLMSA